MNKRFRRLPAVDSCRSKWHQSSSNSWSFKRNLTPNFRPTYAISVHNIFTAKSGQVVSFDDNFILIFMETKFELFGEFPDWIIKLSSFIYNMFRWTFHDKNGVRKIFILDDISTHTFEWEKVAEATNAHLILLNTSDLI